ncbi:MAG: ATP-NAD kinase family protein [Desulfurococcaceae archaeon]
MRLGLVVNPVAGMGGSVGLRGTDGPALEEALRRGARPVAPGRAVEFLRHLLGIGVTVELVVAGGQMGLEEAIAAGAGRLVAEAVGVGGPRTTREDTVRAARAMASRVDLLVFVGGDGTARDIVDAVGTSVPCLGVPSGVKTYSAVFANTPAEAAKVVEAFSRGAAELAEREVVDADEEALRRDELSLRVYGYLLVPVVGGLVQPSKGLHSGPDEEGNKDAIARYLAETMEPGTPYILGPGSTVKALSRYVEGRLTLLGVDVVVDRKVLMSDAWERDLLEVLDRYGRAYVVVTPIGRQGFIFGRGNKQISPAVLRRVGKENVVVVATASKMAELEVLRVDTGDAEVDRMLRGYYKVLVDYGRYAIMRAL